MAGLTLVCVLVCITPAFSSDQLATGGGGESSAWPPTYNAPRIELDPEYDVALHDIVTDSSLILSRTVATRLANGFYALVIDEEDLLFLSPNGTVFRPEGFTPGASAISPQASMSLVYTLDASGEPAAFSPVAGRVSAGPYDIDPAHGTPRMITGLGCHTSAVLTDRNWIHVADSSLGCCRCRELQFGEKIESIHYNPGCLTQSSIFLVGSDELFCLAVDSLELCWSLDLRETAGAVVSTDVNSLLPEPHEMCMDILYAGPYLNQDVLIRDGKLYLTSFNTLLFVIGTDGELAASYDLQDYIYNRSMVHFGDSIVVRSVCGLSVALDRYDEPVWAHNLYQSVYSPPAANDTYLAIADVASSILLLDDSGRLVFVSPVEDRRFIPCMFFSGEHLYAVIQTKGRQCHLRRIDLSPA